MPRKKTGTADTAMQEWASAELGGRDVTVPEARQIVAEYHHDGIDGFLNCYNTDYSQGGPVG